MGRRINEKFISVYMELDRECANRFGVPYGGVTEYINRLNTARFAPGREEVLPRLVRYRNIRNRLAHEISAIRRVTDITKDDIAWLKRFMRAIERKRDPISVYFTKARRYARRRAISRVVTAVASFLFVVIAVIVVILLI